MVTELISDGDRQLLITLLMAAARPPRAGRTGMDRRDQAKSLLRQLEGTDTRIVVERAYASKTVGEAL
jgi:hypothetical protein